MNPATKSVLHLGCGTWRADALYEEFRGPAWRELRVDIDPAVQPDIVAALTDMSAIASAAHDAIYSSHTLEHLDAHEVPVALAECFRVLKPGGTLLLKLPDLEAVCRAVADGMAVTEPLYVSPAGPITPLDVIYGYGKWVAAGNGFMRHRTGFTRASLRAALAAAGFDPVTTAPDRHWNLWGRALRPGG